MKGKKYFIRTYGCQGNLRDSEVIAGILEFLGYTKADKVENADVVLLNTCAVRENAEEKVFGEIGALKKLKRENPDMIFGICGCMAQQPHIVEKILESLPLGNDNIACLRRQADCGKNQRKILYVYVPCRNASFFR